MFFGYLNISISVFLVINTFFSILVVFLGRKNPAVTWAWLMVLIVLPVFGLLLYLTFGIDSRKVRRFSDKSLMDHDIYLEYLTLRGKEYFSRQHEMISKKHVMKIKGTEHLNDFVFLNYFAGNAEISANNRLKLYFEGNAKFDDLIRDIRNAKGFIHMQYYIVRDDELGNRIIRELAEKAKQGVEVLFSLDGMGNAFNHNSFYQPLIKAGGKVGKFLPPRFVRINYRNHRKICVIDGLIGYIGGLNIGNEYLGKDKKFGFWRDTHIRITGDAVGQLELRFLMDWNFMAKDKVKIDKSYFIGSDEENGIPMQIISSGPDTSWDVIHYSYAKMINEADKYIYIQTPYFVPDDNIFESLKIAALSGIDVRIIIPANPDHPFVYWASLSYLGELLRAGVKCYKYEKGFVHSKLTLIDGLVSSVGTANMDVRSFKLNFEINALIYHRRTTEEFEKKFLEDLNDCTEITMEWYNKRPKVTRIKESFSRLLSPLL